MTDHPQEHESLSAFIEKVEVSGEDRKHAPLGYIDAGSANAILQYGDIAVHIHSTQQDQSRLPIYTQQQLDDAVKAERERIADEFSMRMQSDFEHGIRILNERHASAFAIEYPQIASFLEWLNEKDHP